MSPTASGTLEPKLDPPGKGLPIPDRWIARVLVPWKSARSNWDSNFRRFQRYAQEIESIARELPKPALNSRILVSPITGLEDSSRYWSAAMVLDHLMIAGGAFSKIIHDLSHNRVPPIEVRVEKVKPPVQEHDPSVLERYSNFCSTFSQSLNLGAQTKSARLFHPWFGELNAHQWMYIHSVHFGAHLQQLRQIRSKLLEPNRS